MLTLAEGSELELPHNPGNSLSLTLPDEAKAPAGLAFEDKAALLSAVGSGACMPVADKMNQSLMTSQKELLKWCWRLLGHANFLGSKD